MLFVVEFRIRRAGRFCVDESIAIPVSDSDTIATLPSLLSCGPIAVVGNYLLQSRNKLVIDVQHSKELWTDRGGTCIYRPEFRTIDPAACPRDQST